MSVLVGLLVYIVGAALGCASLIHIVHERREIEQAETLRDYFELFVGDSPLIIMGTLFWPVTSILVAPVLLVYLMHRRGIFVRKAIRKLNGGSA